MSVKLLLLVVTISFITTTLSAMKRAREEDTLTLSAKRPKTTDTAGLHNFLIHQTIVCPHHQYLACSRNGTMILTKQERTAYIFNADTGKEIQRITGHTDNILLGAFSPDNKYLITSSSDQTIRMWNIKTGRQCQIIYLSTDYEEEEINLHTIAFSKDASSIIALSFEGYIVTFDIHTGKRAKSAFNGSLKLLLDRAATSFFCPHNLEAFQSPSLETDLIEYGVSQVEFWKITAFNLDNTTLLLGYSEGTTHLLVRETEQEPVLFPHDSDDQEDDISVLCLAISPNNKTVLITTADKKTTLWSYNKTSKKQVPLVVFKDCNSACYGPHESMIITTSSDGQNITLWKSPEAQKWHLIPQDIQRIILNAYLSKLLSYNYKLCKTIPIKDVDSYTINSTATAFALCYYEGTVELWDKRKKPLFIGMGHDITSLSFSLNDDVVTIQARNKAWKTEIQSGKKLLTIEDTSLYTPEEIKTALKLGSSLETIPQERCFYRFTGDTIECYVKGRNKNCSNQPYSLLKTGHVFVSHHKKTRIRMAGTTGCFLEDNETLEQLFSLQHLEEVWFSSNDLAIIKSIHYNSENKKKVVSFSLWDPTIKRIIPLVVNSDLSNDLCHKGYTPHNADALIVNSGHIEYSPDNNYALIIENYPIQSGLEDCKKYENQVAYLCNLTDFTSNEEQESIYELEHSSTKGFISAILFTEFSSDSKVLLTGTSDQLFVWDIKTGRKLYDLPSDTVILQATFMNEGKTLFVSSAKGIFLYDTATGNLLKNFTFDLDDEYSQVGIITNNILSIVDTLGDRAGNDSITLLKRFEESPEELQQRKELRKKTTKKIILEQLYPLFRNLSCLEIYLDQPIPALSNKQCSA